MAGVPRACLHALPGAVGLRARDDGEQATEDAVDAAGPRLDARAAVRVDGDGEARAVGGLAEGDRGGGVELVAVVGEQQGAQRLADRDRAREILVVERLAGLRQPVRGEPIRQGGGSGERVLVVFEIPGVDEVLDHGELVRGRRRHNCQSSIEGDTITPVTKDKLQGGTHAPAARSRPRQQPVP